MRLEKKLLDLRKKNRLSQMEVAEALNVSRQAVSRWEAGSSLPSLENLQSLSQMYGVSLDDLLNKDAEAPVAQEPSKPGKRLTVRLLALSAAFLLLLGIVAAVWMHERGEEEVDLKELQGDETEGLPSMEFEVEW